MWADESQSGTTTFRDERVRGWNEAARLQSSGGGGLCESHPGAADTGLPAEQGGAAGGPIRHRGAADLRSAECTAPEENGPAFLLFGVSQPSSRVRINGSRPLPHEPSLHSQHQCHNFKTNQNPKSGSFGIIKYGLQWPVLIPRRSSERPPSSRSLSASPPTKGKD